VHIRILGPLSADNDGRPFTPTAGKPRQILALLAVHPGRVVPASTLMEELWGTAVSAGAQTTLQTYVVQLRRRLAAALGCGTDPKSVLVTSNGGYMLHVPEDSVDASVYERRVAAGREAFDSGDDARTAELLRSALALWEGPALVDVPAGVTLGIEAMRLEESRLGALELRMDAELGLGRQAELLTELTALTARHPLHEGFHSQVMVALYRCGRRAQALDVYGRLRTRLIRELGLEPTSQLQRLHHALLSEDAVLACPSGRRRGSTYELYGS
jgi:DNA-binding SARP family transcriptional activator